MGALAALFLAAAAWGASFDCARATQPVERAICGDAEVSALDSRMAAAYRANMDTPWAAMIREAQRPFLAERRNFARQPDTLRAMYARQTAMLEAAAALRGHASHGPMTEAQIAAARIALPPDPAIEGERPCRVRETGSPGQETLDGRSLRHAVYAYPDPAHPDEVTLAAVATVVFAAGPDGRFVPVFADRRGVNGCGAPRVFRGGMGATLHLPCHQYGTGNINFESLYAWRRGAWQELDIESWVFDLRQRLPRGLEVWKGIFPNYQALTARTPLWRPGDANCCATGGRADIALRWQGDRLVLRDLRVTRGEAAAAQ